MCVAADFVYPPPPHTHIHTHTHTHVQLFLTQGKDVIVKDVTGMEKVGQGAFATVFKAKYRKTGPEVNTRILNYSHVIVT